LKKLHETVNGSVAEPEGHDNPVQPDEEANAGNHYTKAVIPFNPDGIPEELKALPHWVGWEFQARGDGKPAKVPLDPRTGGKAKANDSKTWGSFEKAVGFSELHGCPGLGFFFSKEDPYVGIDLDGCRNPETGEIEPWAQEIVQRFNSYSEISVSGKGLHIVAKGELPGRGKNQGGIEIYDDRHYFAMTGCLLSGSNPAIENRQDVILEFYSRLQGEQAAEADAKGVREQVKKSGMGNLEALVRELQQAELTPAGEEILRAMASGQFGELIRLLYRGDWREAGQLRKAGPYTSASEADMAMYNFLCRQTGGNPRLMYAIFKETGLGRRKKINRLDYHARTIQTAINGKDWEPEGQGYDRHLRMVTEAMEPRDGSESEPAASAVDAGWTDASPASEAGVWCTPTPQHCGPTLEEGKKRYNPQAIPGSVGSPGGLGDATSIEGPFKKPSYIEGDGISSSISSSSVSSGSAKTPKTSMAEVVRQIALATTGEFTVGEITTDLVKSLGNSPLPTMEDEWRDWRKLVSNELGRLVKKRLLVRTKGKKGIFRRTGIPSENHKDKEQIIDGLNKRIELLKKYKDEPGEAGQFLKIPMPLGLAGHLKLHKGSKVVIAGVASTGKTIIGMQWAADLRKYMEVYYFQTELSKEERVERRSTLEAHLGLPPGTLENEIEWIRPRSLNALDDKAMEELSLMVTPGAAVFIDYLQISDKFYRIGNVIPKLARNIGDGLLVIFVQKDRHKPTGRGDSHLEEFPRVVLTLDPLDRSDDRCILRFRKWKAKANPGRNLSDLEILYCIDQRAMAVVPIKEKYRTPEKKQKTGKNNHQVPPPDHKKESPSSEG